MISPQEVGTDQYYETVTFVNGVHDNLCGRFVLGIPCATPSQGEQETQVMREQISLSLV